MERGPEQQFGAPDYEPSPEVMERLSEMTYVGLIGPSAIGKNTVANTLVERLGRSFGKVTSYTTRDPRPGEVDGFDYRFMNENVDEALQTFDVLKEEGFLVQYADHPTKSGIKYWTDLDCWHTQRINVLDTLPSAVMEMRSLPFKNRFEIVLVSEFAPWINRLESQTFDNPYDYRDRLEEAMQNMEWSIDHPEAIFLENIDGQFENLIHEIDQVANKIRMPDQRRPRRILEETLDSTYLHFDRYSKNREF